MNLVESSLILTWLRKALSREGALARGFERSVLLRALDAIVLAVPRLLRAVYNISPPLWENSLIVRLIRMLGQRPELLLSWFIFFLLIMPQQLWGNSYIFAFCLLLLLLLWFSVSFSRGGEKLSERLSLLRFGFWLTAWTLLIFIYVPDSYSTSVSLRALPRYLSYLLVLYVMLGSGWTLSGVRRIVQLSLFGLIIVSLYAIIQRFQGLELSASYVDIVHNPKMPGRVYSFFENPNALAFALVTFLPFTLAFTFYGKGCARKYLGLASFFMAGAALLMTYSRGPWMAFVFEAFIFVLIVRPRLVPYLIAAGVVALPILPRNISNRILSVFLGDSSFGSRIGLYEASVSLIFARPLGAGLGLELPRMYINNNSLYDFLTYNAAYIHAHNLVLQIINELGAVGLIAFFGALLSGIKTSVLRAIKTTGERRALVAAGVSAMAGVLFCGIADYPLSYARVMLLFWLVFGLTIAASRIEEELSA